MCDNRFYYCLRDQGRTDVESDPRNCGPLVSMVNDDGSWIDFDRPTVLGLSNPLSLVGPTSQWQVRDGTAARSLNSSPIQQ